MRAPEGVRSQSASLQKANDICESLKSGDFKKVFANLTEIKEHKLLKLVL